MKVLCCCWYGNARSHHAALILKDIYHQDAIAVGLGTSNGDDTRRMLFEWADLILLMTEEVAYDGRVPEEFDAKVRLWDVGPDHYDYTNSAKLFQKILAHLDASGIDFGPEQETWAQVWRATP